MTFTGIILMSLFKNVFNVSKNKGIKSVVTFCFQKFEYFLKYCLGYTVFKEDVFIFTEYT